MKSQNFSLAKNKIQVIVTVGVVLVTVAVGLALLRSSGAASPATSAQPENGQLTSPASAVSDTTASGGSAIKFGQPAPAGSSIYWGALMSGKPYCNCADQDSPWIPATYDRFEQNAGKKASLVHWGQWNPWSEPLAQTPLNLVNSRGGINFYTTSTQDTPLTDITAGKYDAGLIRWAQGAKAFGRPFFLRFNWEMNGDWYGWGKQAQQNPANYVAAWRHFHNIVTAQGATNVTWVFCPNIEYGGSTSLAALYPGDAYVDWTCIDGYNWGTSAEKPNESWKSFTTVIKPTYDRLLSVAPNKPIVIGETSTNDSGGSQAAWTSSVLKTELPNNFPRIKGLVWFNWNVFENNKHWPFNIESSPAHQAAFREGIASPYYRANNYGNLPMYTKVPIPQ